MSEIGGSKTGSAFDWEVLRKIFRFVKPYNKVFYFVIFLTVASAVLATVRPFLIQEMVDKQILQNNWAGVNRMFIWLIVLLILHTGVSYLHTYFAGWLGQ